MKNILLFLISLLFSFSSIAMEERYKDLLQKLVNLNSGTQNVEGVLKVSTILQQELRQRGLEVKRVENAQRSVIIAKFPGSSPDILLMGHIDTVFSKQNHFQKLRQEEGKLIGPGVIDMKGGIVLMLNLLDSLSDDVKRNVLIIINDDEEIGSSKSKPIYLQEVQNVKHALVFEPGLPDGSFVSSQSGVKWINIKINGVASHAGTDHRVGTNACAEAGYKVVKLHELTDYSRDLTVNVGVISGGEKPNIVCKEALVRVDIRYRNNSDLLNLMGNIQQITEQVHVFGHDTNNPTNTKVVPIAQLPSFSKDSSQALIPYAKAAAQINAMPFKHSHVGYGSDGNHLSTLPINILVGLGPYGGGMHTDQEFMIISSYKKRLSFSKTLIKLLVKGTTDEHISSN